MALIPKKVKYRKWHTFRENPRKVGVATRGTTIAFGLYALKATTYERVRSNQLESARKVLSRAAGKGGKIWIRIFPDKPMTKKGDETPMGKGKGSVDHFVAKIKQGRILFEMDGVTEDLAKEAMRLASHKLNVKTKFVFKDK